MQTGSKVVCVNDDFTDIFKKLYRQLPVKGTTYTVRGMFLGRDKICHIQGGKIVKNPDPYSSAEVAILLVELTNGEDPFCPGKELAFRADRFADLETIEQTEQIEEMVGAGADNKPSWL